MIDQGPIALSSLPVGGKGKVDSILLDGLIKRRLLDLGVIRNSIIEVVRVSPIGDPTAYLIKGALIGLRKNETSKVMIYPIS
ncbi:MAG: ferrous iron transport protein A [Vulcanibacillus sp.]